jgi:hypothetical protein
MSRIRLALGALVATVALSAFSPAVTRVVADLTGTWLMSVATPNGDVGVTVVLKQAGDSVSGTIESDVSGKAELTGLVKNDTLRAAFTADMQGTQVPMQITGILTDKDNMSGSIEVAGMGGFPFVGKRQQP